MSSVKIWFIRGVRSKTIRASTIIAVLGVIQANKDFLSTFLTPKQFGFVMLGIAIIMVILRAKTTNALEDK